MDFKTLITGINLDEISLQVKEVINLVKEENQKVELLPGEDRVYILLDMKQKDIIAYRVTVGVDELQVKENAKKQFNVIKRTIGKYNLDNLKNLVEGVDVSGIESKLRMIMPLIYGANSLMKLEKDEKKVMIQLDISDTDIIAYQVVTAIVEPKPTEFYLVISRVLGKYNLSDYLK